ncbi:hypothetical protein D3C71_717070 [compost metagenome]
MRKHVIGERVTHLINPRAIFATHDVSNDDEIFFRTDVIAYDHRAVAHPGMTADPGFDLPKLDAESANLHLIVFAPGIAQVTVCVEPDPISRAIQALAGVWVKNEFLIGQRWLVQIAARKSGAGNVQLAYQTGGQQAAMVVEHVHLGICDRPAYGFMAPSFASTPCGIRGVL